MADLFRNMFARPWPPVAVMVLLGALLGYLELGTPAAVLFMLAGLLIMVASVQVRDGMRR